MEKKGQRFTLAQTMKITLGIISILLLGVLAVALYGSVVDKAKEKQAEASLEEIVGRINNLDEGKSINFPLQSPKGWYLVKLDNSLCFCSDYDISNCLSDGVCQAINKDLLFFEKCYEYGSERMLGCISLSSVPVEIGLNLRDKQTVEIYSYSSVYDLTRFKKEGLSKNILGLALDYVNNPKNKEIKIQLDDSLKDYFELNSVTGFLKILDSKEDKIYSYVNYPRGEHLEYTKIIEIKSSSREVYQISFTEVVYINE